jgi:hypothetical protein
MVAQYNRKLKSGAQFDGLIPKPKNEVEVVSQSTNISETVDWIVHIIYTTLWQTKALAPKLAGRTLIETCQNIWEFIYEHIQYREDDKDAEQLHEPARIWAKRKIGVDCDDFTMFASSLLLHLGIAHSLRLAEYNYKGYYQHIYVVVWLPNGEYITIDPVKDEFNLEHPYTNYEDINMELQVLRGLYGLSGLTEAEKQSYRTAFESLPLAQREGVKKWLIGKNPEFYSPKFKEIYDSVYDYVSGSADAEVLNHAELNYIYLQENTLDLLKGNQISPEKLPSLQTTGASTDPGKTPKRTWQQWAKENQTPLIVTGVLLGVAVLVGVSYLAEAEAQEKEKAEPKTQEKNLQGIPKKANGKLNFAGVKLK